MCESSHASRGRGCTGSPVTKAAEPYREWTYTLAFSVYVGIDDPEFVAHAIQGIGLLIILREPRTTVRVLTAAALFAAGVFVKHDAIALRRHFPRDRHVLFCTLYAAIATIAGVIVLGGGAVGWNVMFDSNAAFCVSASLALNRWSPVSRPDLRSRRLALSGGYAVVLVAVAAITAAVVSTPRQWVTMDHWLAPRAAAAEAGRDIEFLRRADGPVLCEELSLCYWAGKTVAIDFFNMRQRIRQGSRSGSEVLALIVSRDFGAIQLDSLKSYFDPRFLEALLGGYAVDHTDQYGVFLAPRR